MKKNTMLSTVLAAIMFASAGSAMAESHLLTKDVKVVKRAAKKVEVRVNQPNTGTLEVVLKDNEGTTVHTGKIQGGENMVTLFNLNSLPNGQYTLSCANASFWSAQNLVIKNGEVEIVENTYQEAFKPSVEEIGNNRFAVTTFNKNVADMPVIISDLQGETLYSGYLSTANRYNLNNLPAGEYVFEFAVGDKSFKQYVKVK
ncbi:MAG: hypothetical protein ACK4GN_11665 [Runella sp.]